MIATTRICFAIPYYNPHFEKVLYKENFLSFNKSQITLRALSAMSILCLQYMSRQLKFLLYWVRQQNLYLKLNYILK